jgi:hypothetical protein
MSAGPGGASRPIRFGESREFSSQSIRRSGEFIVLRAETMLITALADESGIARGQP